MTRETETGTILLFIHDSIDVQVRDDEKERVAAILKDAVTAPMLPFPLRFTGELVDRGRTFAGG